MLSVSKANLGFVFMSILCCALASGCTGPAPNFSSFEIHQPKPEEETAIQIGDVITIFPVGISDSEAFRFRVNESGAIDLPLLGLIQVAGKTCAELEQELTKAYRKNGLRVRRF